MRALLVFVLLALLAAGCAETSEQRPDKGSPGSDKTCETSANAEAKTTTGSRETSQGTELRDVIIDASGGEKVEVWVEVADNSLGRLIGLRGRKSLPENRGMLFSYTEEDDRSFTMEDTVIPLSIAFMDSGGCIVDIQDMEPQTDGYDSAEPAQYALEVNKGFFEERGVEVGDRAKLPR
jgi:uncharacterized protein